jgi:hypothetical protein
MIRTAAAMASSAHVHAGTRNPHRRRAVKGEHDGDYRDRWGPVLDEDEADGSRTEVTTAAIAACCGAEYRHVLKNDDRYCAGNCQQRQRPVDPVCGLRARTFI